MVIDPLVVRIIDTLTGESWVYLFPVGPVRVGCGADCSLTIARPFVSAQQGTFVFDDHSVRYRDDDPQSGTRIDGVPAGGREKTLTDWSQIEMGDLRLTTSRRAPDQPVADPTLSPFARPQARRGGRRQEPPPAAEPPPPRSKRPAAQRRGDESGGVVPARRSRAVERPPRRRVKRRFSILAWLGALALGTAVVAAAGLMLQFRGLPWMPPALLSRIPPWLAEWSGNVHPATPPPAVEDPARQPTTVTPAGPRRPARSRR